MFNKFVMVMFVFALAMGVSLEANAGTSAAVRFRPLHSNKCIDLKDQKTAPGTVVHQWDCGLSLATPSSRVWVLEVIKGDVVKIKSYKDQAKCLYRGKDKYVSLQKCGSSKSFQWKIKKETSDAYSFASLASTSEYLTVFKGSKDYKSNGARIGVLKGTLKTNSVFRLSTPSSVKWKTTLSSFVKEVIKTIEVKKEEIKAYVDTFHHYRAFALPKECDKAATYMINDAIKPHKTGCNGYTELCSKRYNEVVYVSSHNAFASLEKGFLPAFATQCSSIQKQLDAGVRSFMLDVHHWDGQLSKLTYSAIATSIAKLQSLAGVITLAKDLETMITWGKVLVEYLKGTNTSRQAAMDMAGQRKTSDPLYLCHGLCFTGSSKLVTVFREIKSWMDRYPNEVITFILEENDYNVSDGAMKKALEDSGLFQYLYKGGCPNGNKTWPTLKEMIDSKQRLVLFTNKSTVDSSYSSWYLKNSDCTYANKYEAKKKDSWSCSRHTGDNNAKVRVMNHFYTDPLASPKLAQDANKGSSLKEHYNICVKANRKPTHIAVDYIGVGEVLKFVKSIQPEKK